MEDYLVFAPLKLFLFFLVLTFCAGVQMAVDKACGIKFNVSKVKVAIHTFVYALTGVVILIAGWIIYCYDYWL